MGKINQIQNALRELSEGKFQKLADAYLVEKKLGIVNSTGSVVGADKTRKGRPDTLITLPNGNYALAEHTTQQTGLLDKLKDDFAGCFMEDETGVPIEKIEKVILCFNSKLDTKEVIELQELAGERIVQLFLFGLDAISHDIALDYPSLARQYLDIEPDTGQIVSLAEFVSLHSRDKMSAGIDQSFYFRKEEIDNMLSTLESKSLVILTGGAGVGKTRLALELCRKFSEQNTEYQAKCVFGRHRDLWDDLQIYFNKPGNFLILVDDANRLSRFEYVVDLLLEKRDGRNIKVVVTVRDYAIQKILKVANRVGDDNMFAVKPFTDEQVGEFLKEEYGIKNHRYIKRIVGIVKGNPRLAVMAAKAALAGDLELIHNVTDLYEDYFSSIKDGLLTEKEELNIDVLIKVISIISLFEAVDYSNREQMEIIENTFNLHHTVFWETALLLHEFELADMYENEVIRIPDQVLSTYCFYQAFFNNRLLDIGSLLRNLFPRLQDRIVFSINSVTKVFDSQVVLEVIRPIVKAIWTETENEDNDPALLELIDTFWIADTTGTLLWAQQYIENLVYQPAQDSDIGAKRSDTIPRPSALSILSRFSEARIDEARKALSLLMKYLDKRPGDLPMVLSVVTGNFGYDENSHLRKYEIQHVVVDTIWERAESGEPPFPQLFLETANELLETHIQSFRDTGKRRIEILEFNLLITPDLTSLREKIWNRLFHLGEHKVVREDVLAAIVKYTKTPMREINSEVVKEDMRHLFPFLEKSLDADRYQHCIIGNAFLDFLEHQGIDVPEGARDQYKHETYMLAKVLLMNWGESRRLEMSHEEFEQYKKEELRNHTSRYGFDDYVRFFESCDEIRTNLEDRKEYQLSWGMTNIILLLAQRDINLCERVLRYYFSLKAPPNINGYPIVKTIMDKRGPEETYALFMNRKFINTEKLPHPGSRNWSFRRSSWPGIPWAALFHSGWQ